MSYWGKIAVAQVRLLYSSTNVTTGAWVELVASISGSCSQITVFDSSGQTMELGVGPAGSEVIQFLVFPGGNGTQDLFIPQGSRVAIKAVSGTASSGELDLNCFN